MKRALAIAACLLVAACASPTMKMSDQQIFSLSDDQLCSYKNNYRDEPRLEAELAERQRRTGGRDAVDAAFMRLAILCF